MKKRGLSSVVTSLILILLVLVAIGLVWLVINRVLTESSTQLDVGRFTTEIEIIPESVHYNSGTGDLSFTLKKNPGGEKEVDGIRVDVYYQDEIFQEKKMFSEPLGNLETTTISFKVDVEPLFEKITKILAYPIYISETTGEEVVVQKANEYVLTKEQGGDDGDDGTTNPSNGDGDLGDYIPLVCKNNVQDSGEAGIDCGGFCPYNCPINRKVGIDVLFDGSPGIDYAEEYFYFNTWYDDAKVVYIKADTPIKMQHNERNTNYAGKRLDNDFGTIRYKVDRDLQWKYKWAKISSDTTTLINPAYTQPFTFNDLTYSPDDSVSVVGTTGPKPGIPLDKNHRDGYYYRGILDDFGDEWHVITVADDDTTSASTNVVTKASDGRFISLVVNPKTPLISFENTSASGQFYTTPAKIYFIPKIHEQTTYLTDDIKIKFVNIMNGNSVMYRIDGGNWIEYKSDHSEPILSSSLSDGTHTIEYYYDNSYHKTRTIVKNPSYPSDADSFDSSLNIQTPDEHGYLLWHSDAEFYDIKTRVKDPARENGLYYIWYHQKYNSITFLKTALGRAFVSLVEGNIDNPDPTYAGYVKDYYFFNKINSTKDIIVANPNLLVEDFVGFELHWDDDAIPMYRLNTDGYHDVPKVLSFAFAYDLLVSKYRPENGYEDGFTAIEDYKIRDDLAKWSHLCLMQAGGYSATGSYKLGMWGNAKCVGALAIALAMPSYDTPYYGASGFDGSSATHKWAPYPDVAVSWRDLLYDKSNSLSQYPNPEYYISLEGGMISTTEQYRPFADDYVPAGSFADRIGYYELNYMGQLFHIYSNILNIKFGDHFEFLEISYVNSNNEEMYGLKWNDPIDIPPRYFGQLMLVNERFPQIAGKAYYNLKNGIIPTYFADNEANEMWEQFYIPLDVYPLIFFHDDYVVDAGCDTDPNCALT